MRVLRWLVVSTVVLALAAGALVFAYSGPYPPGPRSKRIERFDPAPATGGTSPSDRVVVLLVFDGLAPALIRKTPTPELDRIAAEGAFTVEMSPVFPTLSMPNHTSLLTGCYPARHGVVSNHFLDPERGLYSGDLGDASWLQACEPLSEVAERQGVETTFLGWVGAQRGHQLLVTRGGPHEADAPSIDERVAQVEAELAGVEDPRARLIVGYLNEPDHSLHEYGVDAPEPRQMMAQVDAAVGRVRAAIERAQLQQRATLVVTTDHGMIDAGKHLNIERVLRNHDVDATIAAHATVAHVYLDDPATRDAAAAALSTDERFEVIVPGSASDWTHLGASPRLGDLVISLHPGHHMFDRGRWPALLRWAAPFGPEVLRDRRVEGMHGYAPDTPGVEAVFYAVGAGVAAGATLAGLRTIDVHPTLCRLLSIEPGEPVDGRAFEPLFAEPRLDAAEVTAEIAEPADVTDVAD